MDNFLFNSHYEEVLSYIEVKVFYFLILSLSFIFNAKLIPAAWQPIICRKPVFLFSLLLQLYFSDTALNVLLQEWSDQYTEE